jgi:hypothetical protein
MVHKIEKKVGPWLREPLSYSEMKLQFDVSNLKMSSVMKSRIRYQSLERDEINYKSDDVEMFHR